MDTCVIPLRHGGLSLVQTTDYIYPIVDDPYMMVWISSFMGITFCPSVCSHGCHCCNYVFVCNIGSEVLYTPNLYVLKFSVFLFCREELLVPMF